MPSPLLVRLRAALAAACRVAEAAAIAALIAATALILLQVLAREALAIGLPWADELARFAGFCIIFLVVPALLASDEHVKVDVLQNMLPPGPRRLTRIGNELLNVAFAALFLYAGWLFMQKAWKFTTPAVGIPNLVWYLPAIVGMILMLLVAIERSAAALAGGADDGERAAP